jgi:hypothetical protein
LEEWDPHSSSPRKPLIKEQLQEETGLESDKYEQKRLTTSISKITTFGGPSDIEPRLSKGLGLINLLRPPVAGIKRMVIFPNVYGTQGEKSVAISY